MTKEKNVTSGKEILNYQKIVQKIWKKIWISYQLKLKKTKKKLPEEKPNNVKIKEFILTH